jgi:hypothetical protein
MKTPKVTTTLVPLAKAIFLAGPFLAGSPANSGGAEAIEPGERSLVGGEYDLTGSWTYEATIESGIPPFIVEALGLIPEGEITYLTCETRGEMELVQTGEIFDGTATQVLSSMTDGGQGPFWPPSFPPEVTNGVVSGKDTSFAFGTCNFTAKVVGSGDKLMGEGPCPIPLPPRTFSKPSIGRPSARIPLVSALPTIYCN